MDALEEYYSMYLMSYNEASNCESFDLEEQATKDRVEQILLAGYMNAEDVVFVKGLLPDIENLRIREELAEYLETLVII